MKPIIHTANFWRQILPIPLPLENHVLCTLYTICHQTRTTAANVNITEALEHIQPEKRRIQSTEIYHAYRVSVLWLTSQYKLSPICQELGKFTLDLTLCVSGHYGNTPTFENWHALHVTLGRIIKMNCSGWGLVGLNMFYGL